MKHRILTLITVTMFTLLGPALPMAFAMDLPFPTTTDYPAALQQAREQDKPVLLLYLAEWCGHCQALKQKVLDTEVFTQFAEENLVTVAYDIAHKDELPADHQAQMEALVEKFQISGTPGIVLLQPQDESVILQSTGYGGTEAEKVIALFKEHIAAAKQSTSADAKNPKKPS